MSMTHALEMARTPSLDPPGAAAPLLEAERRPAELDLNRNERGLGRATARAPGRTTAELAEPPVEQAGGRPAQRQKPDRDFAAVPVAGGVVGGPPAVKRSTGRGGVLRTIGSFFSGLVTRPGTTLERLFGGEDVSHQELVRYLQGLTRRNDIEGDFDSDNKARAVVKRWRSATAGYQLTGRQKALLIREMLTGATTDADENAILDLLTRAENGDLRLIFAAVPAKDLLSDFHGAEHKRLKAWLEARFDGGIDAVRKDDIQPRGGLPADAPLHPYDWARFRVKFEGGYLPQEIIEELARHPLAERERAARDLAVERTALNAKVLEVSDRMDRASDAATKDALDLERQALRLKLLRMDVVMQEGFKDIALAESPTDLAAKATVLTPAQQAAARSALKPPPGMAAPTGGPTPFVDTLPGEALSYEGKLRAAAPGMIDRYWDHLAKDRQPADHSDPAKMHTLTEMEGLAKVGKDETDAVFGNYYDKARHPPMRADRPGRRGNLHDLWQDTQDFLTDPSIRFSTKQTIARALVFYFFQSDTITVAPLNRAHNASPSFDRNNRPRNAEATAQDRVARDVTRTAAQVRRLNEIDRAWDASANPRTRDVNIQLFRPPGGTRADQDFMWDMFQTLIHEYLHTLVHSRYMRFADSFGRSSPENNTLMEGVDSFLDEIVWANIQPRVNDLDLRRKVEGPAYAALPPIPVRHPLRRRYASYTEAVRLVTIVGYRNLILAYFRGEIDKIGG
jgi:hypothetical protein